MGRQLGLLIAGLAIALACAAPPRFPLPPLPTDNPTPDYSTPDNPALAMPTPTTRNPLLQPFASDSIWNQPIGSEARYVPVDIAPANFLQADEDHFYVLSDGDPLRPLFSIGNWEGGRATGTIFQNIALPLPDDFVIPDSRAGDTPNNAAAFLLPDGRTLVQVNALTRLAAGTGQEEMVYGWRSPNEDILGPGIGGGHAGSGLSSIGGTLRRGELVGSEPIRHALKINLWARQYLSYELGAGGGPGYRWPADRADSYASPETYGGTTPELQLGSLLAIPPDLSPEQLGLTTEPARKLFEALRDYGAYVVDDTAFDAHAFALEIGAKEEFEAHYGFGFEGTSGPFFNDVMTLFGALAVVDNNAPEAIGGGGTPRVPLAPPIAEADLPAVGPSQVRTASPEEPILYGGPAGDFLYGDAGDNQLFGGGGNNYLDGGGGNNQLFGGPGDDLLVARPGQHHYDGGGGTDTLLVALPPPAANGAVGLSDTALGPPPPGQRPGLAAALGIGPATVGATPFAPSTLASLEKAVVVGGAGSNWLDASGFGGRAQLDGGTGNDWLIGGSGPNDLRGGTGSDGLIGGPGDDLLQGSNPLQRSGIDWLVGGGGRDRFILGQAGLPHYRDGEGPNFAILADFDPAEDVIQLGGNPWAYRLVPGVPDLLADAWGEETALSLYWVGRGTRSPDLIAVLLNAEATLDLTPQSPAFIYDNGIYDNNPSG
nr:calcium-binding protein [Nodosilinea sp. TSF1-S3]